MQRNFKTLYKKLYLNPKRALRDSLHETFPKLIGPRDMSLPEERLSRGEIEMYTKLEGVDESVFGDCLVPDDIDEALEQIEAQKSLAQYRVDSSQGVEANIIIDFFVLWGTKEDGTEFNKLPETRMIAAAKHCHDYFRNRGDGYSELNTDSYINFSTGNVHYIHVNDVWPDYDYFTYGVAHSGTGGLPGRTVYEYCKSIAGTTGDGTRYAAIIPNKISSTNSTGTILGYAYVAASATAWNAGNVTIGPYTGLTEGPLRGSKTLIHEIGHSFGLWHTFQFTAADCSVGDLPCEQAGDRICDTPTENRVPNSGCFATNPNNHMSYSYHTNRVLFTAGQIYQMTATLLARFPLVWSNPRVYWSDENTGVDLPTVSLSVYPESINQGDSVLIEWEVTNADTIESYGFDANGQFSGAITLENVQESINIRVVGRNVSGPVQEAKFLNVIVPIPLPEVTISVDPSVIEMGGSTTVTWDAKNVTSVSPSGFRATGYSGSTVISNLTADGEVSLTGNNQTGSITASAQYTVTQEATLPSLISFDQVEPVGDNGLGLLDIEFKDADEVTIELTNQHGTHTYTHTVEKVGTPPSDLIASFKGENFLEELGWRESISGKYATGSATEYSDSDGVGVLFGKDITEVLEFADLQHGDYTYKIKLKPNVIGSVKSILSKRIHHSNNQSWLFLFTFTGNRIFWDNTTNLNRMDSGIVPVAGEVMEIHVTRDLGMWINGVKVAESGNADIDLINDAILRIGNDHTASNRGLEGIIYSIDIYNKSIAI